MSSKPKTNHLQITRTGTLLSMSSKLVLPPIVAFPEAAWRNHLVPDEWEACLDAWISLAEAHLSLSSADFARLSVKDESLPTFLTSFAAEASSSHDVFSSSDCLKAKRLWKDSFLLSYRLLEVDSPPEPLLRWQFLADVSRVYGKNHAGHLVTAVWRRHAQSLEASMSLVKKNLIKELEAGLSGDLKIVEAQLKQLNHLLHASPEVAAFIMAGGDFVDSLISGYKLMNPPLRKAILSTLYLCLIGLTEGKRPKFSTLVDQLYALKTGAESHRAGPTNVNDSLVAELITATPVLQQVRQRLEANGSESNRARSVLNALEGFRKPGGNGRPQYVTKRKIDKGKVNAILVDEYGHGSDGQIHVHRISLITQVQDLFPDIGSGFVIKLLDEYNDDVEQLIAHLLEESLPSHLDKADRFEEWDVSSQIISNQVPDDASPSTPPHTPIRRNVFDDDKFDQLAVDTSRLHFGRRNPEQTADDVLQDRSSAPNKAAILSALAAFDSDDDERDDTYDIEDVGDTVDSAAQENNVEGSKADVRDSDEEALFRAYTTTPKIFHRDAVTRRSNSRMSLKEDTGMTDEAIEGWGLMLSRDSLQMRRLEAKFSNFTGGQKELAPTAWRSSPAGSGTEDSDVDSNHRRRGGFRARGGRGGQDRARDSVAGHTTEKDTEIARLRKEANKASRANHNRRDQRARKMARGGFTG